MALPARIRDKQAERDSWRKPNRTGRWKSRKHCDFVRQFACSKCGETAGIEVAHVRLATDGGMGRKPSDFYTVSLCGPCHREQHIVGEETFWRGHDVRQIMRAFCENSPAKYEIARYIQESGHAA